MTEPRTLRLTGQQLDSIQPPVSDEWLIDFDEYEDFIVAPAAGVLGDEGLRAALVDQINDEAARLRNAGMNHLYVAGVEDAARFVRDRAALATPAEGEDR